MEEAILIAAPTFFVCMYVCMYRDQNFLGGLAHLVLGGGRSGELQTVEAIAERLVLEMISAATSGVYTPERLPLVDPAPVTEPNRGLAAALELNDLPMPVPPSCCRMDGCVEEASYALPASAP